MPGRTSISKPLPRVPAGVKIDLIVRGIVHCARYKGVSEHIQVRSIVGRSWTIHASFTSITMATSGCTARVLTGGSQFLSARGDLFSDRRQTHDA